MIYATRIPREVSDETVDRLWASASDAEAFLHSLREHGASKIESISALRRAANIGLGEAKDIVHFSPTWQDRRASDEAFHESVYAAVERIQREDETAEANSERLAS